MYLRKQCILDNFLSLTHQMRRGSGRVFHIHSVECLWVRFPSLPPYGLTTVLTFASSTPLTTWHLNISGCEINNYPPTLLVLEGYTKRSYIHIWHHSVRHSNTNRVGGWSELGAEYILIRLESYSMGSIPIHSAIEGVWSGIPHPRGGMPMGSIPIPSTLRTR